MIIFSYFAFDYENYYLLERKKNEILIFKKYIELRKQKMALKRATGNVKTSSPKKPRARKSAPSGTKKTANKRKKIVKKSGAKRTKKQMKK